MNVDKLAIITDSTITIETGNFALGFTTLHKELLLNLFETYYQGQQIVVIANDGENIEYLGVINFFENICQQSVVPRSAVIFKTHHQQWNYNFQHKKLRLSIFSNTKNFLQQDFDFADLDSDAKFIGCLISRFTPSRFNLAYQLDCAFPNDNFLIFRPTIDEVNDHYSLIDGGYQTELDWLSSKKFDTDEILVQAGHGAGFLDWKKSTATYHTLWSKYQIECVVETNVFSNFFFTEKTSRCLATGKPFVLLSGPGSLKTLQDFGFKTFGNVIDESYDTVATPRRRITAILQSLKDLYHSADRAEKINQLNNIARHNQLLYDKICRKI